MSIQDRRQFLIDAGRGIGAAAVGGLVWAGHLAGSRNATAVVLRPPGAREEKEFLARCTKCGLCAEACPFGAVKILAPGDGRPVGTPYFTMRENPCRMCRDIPCAAACPTGALDLGLVSDADTAGRRQLNINKAHIGLAVIDRETCIAYWGIQCDACYRVCPVMDRALTVEFAKNDRTGKHAVLGPVVHGEHCTGCGVCERACVTKKASIFVLPRYLATGESSPHYLRGWREQDAEGPEKTPDEAATKTPRSEKTPLDYLNREEF